MTILESIILGIVQGITEFLPISSSAHLVVLPWLFDINSPGLSFDVALHFGTLLAIILYFWKDWLQIFQSSFLTIKNKDLATSKDKHNFNLLLYIIVATIPAGLIGLLLQDFIEIYLRHPLLIAFNMAVLGFLLMMAEKMNLRHRHLKHIRWLDAILIGVFQACALFPGVSRSGITMTVGLFRGFDRVSAARFSFLLATPVMFGAAVLKANDFIEHDLSMESLIGIFVSALVGFLSIRYLIQYVSKHSFKVFAYYRFAFSVLVLILYLLKS